MAYQVSQEAIVLLENDGILPLKNVSRIGIIGEFAEKPRVNGGGSATLKAFKMENPLDEFKKEFSIDYSKGYCEENTSDELLNDVKKVLDNNDTIIFFTGTTESLESEGRERPHMKLPQGHLDVFNVIKKSGKNVIVILNNGSALDVSEISGNSNAIFESWLLGGANSKALVDVITGRINPSGRLSETFPKKLEHTPFYGEYPCNADTVDYSADLMRLGYRYYDTHHYDVQYPFGFGLSYSKFEYSNLRLGSDKVRDDELLYVNFTITNTSDVDGFEVPQIYVSSTESYYPKPRKELKAYTKVFVAAGASIDVSITLDKNAFSIYSVDFEDFRAVPGKYEILVGKNVRDIELVSSIDYFTEVPYRKPLDENQPITNFKLYKTDVYDYLIKKYGKLEWYDMEQPMKRILFRINRDFKLSDSEYTELKKKIYE